MAGIDKVVVTNMGALKAKYGARVKRIRRALRDLELANGQRGLVTQIVALDDAKQMAAYSAPAVEQPDDPVQVKVAIDAVYRALQPACLMILGSVDIVPHQRLDNLAFSADDTNRIVDSDLPYACDAPYGTRVADFIGPTRVVGRLPDVTGHADPVYLEKLLLVAASEAPQQAPGGNQCLGISAQKWGSLTRTTLKNVFTTAPPSVHLSPKEGPAWADLFVRMPLHFINCHGAKADCRFYGDTGRAPAQDEGDPIAHDSSCIANRVAAGTVVASECCYGAHLYDPAEAGGVPGICNTYLGSGAYAFFGSSTVAYGGHTGNESADLLCQHFLQYVLAGVTTGEAVTQARHDFVNSNRLDPVNLKTLAQFNLMGDPSLRPFLPAAVPVAGQPIDGAGGPEESERLAEERRGRVARLATRGESLRRATAVAHEPVHVPAPQKTIREILRFAKVTGGWGRPELQSFTVSTSPDDEQAPAHPSTIHVVTRRAPHRSAPFDIIELIIATEVDEEIVAYRHVASR